MVLDQKRKSRMASRAKSRKSLGLDAKRSSRPNLARQNTLGTAAAKGAVVNYDNVKPGFLPIAGGAQVKAGDPVWFRDPDKKVTDVFSKATITSVAEDARTAAVTMSSGKTEDKQGGELYPANTTDDLVGDNTALVHLNEPTILCNVKLRYAKNQIYTFTGRILVAINPFQRLDIYGQENMKRYQGKDVSKLANDAPHVFAVGENAYAVLRRTAQDQSVLMAGESGAGKTETTKQLMLYLASRARAPEAQGAALSDAIIGSNPITEGFGNARTSRNNNSSRFGKFTKIHFNKHGQVAGAMIRSYLLERSRITQVAQGERTYHIFYMVVCGATADERKQLRLGSSGVGDFGLCSMSGQLTLPDKSDVALMEELRGSYVACGFSSEEVLAVSRIVVGVLHFGNIAYEENDQGHGRAAPHLQQHVDNGEAVLGLEKISDLLTQRLITAGRGSMYTKKLNKVESAHARDAMVRIIFVRLFDWLCERINRYISGGSPEALHEMKFIGLLDIFGFERFEHNSFEQLCINFTNEKLQQFFLTCVFKAEEEIHKSEGVKFVAVEFQDNQGCIDLIEKLPSGILRLLDSQNKTPGGSGAKFFLSVNESHKASEFLKPVQKARRRPEEVFIVAHFAGDVCYDGHAGSWLDKNNDTLPTEIQLELESSSLPLLQSLFKQEGSGAETPRGGGGGGGLASGGKGMSKGMSKAGGGKKSSTFNSISRRFISDLSLLIADLGTTDSHFIRCIKPNTALKASLFESKIVLDQLRCGGIFDAVEVMKAAYPTRIPFDLIYGKYASLLPPHLVADLPPAGFCEVVALSCNVPTSAYAIGFTRIFLRPGEGVFLEELLTMDMKEVVPLLTEKIREWRHRQGCARKITRAVQGWYHKKVFRRKRRAAKVVQRCWRGSAGRSKADQLRMLVQIAIDAHRKDRDAEAVARAAEERRRIAAQREEQARREVLRKQQEAEAKRKAEEDKAKAAVAAVEGMKRDLHAITEQNEQLRAAADGSAKQAEQKLVEVMAQLDATRKELAAARAEAVAARQNSEAKQQLEARDKQLSDATIEIAQLRSELDAEKLIAARLEAQLSEAIETGQIAKLDAEGKAQAAATFERALASEAAAKSQAEARAAQLARETAEAHAKVKAFSQDVAGARAMATEKAEEAAAARKETLMAANAAEQARRAAEQAKLAAAELKAVDENADEVLDLQISRDEETGTLGVDIDEWQGKVTVGVIRPGAPAAGKLAVGDIIEGVAGKNCHNEMAEVLRAIIESPDVVTLRIVRPALLQILGHDMTIKEKRLTPRVRSDGDDDDDGEWREFVVTLYNTRQLVYEPLHGADADGADEMEINLRSVVQLEMQEAIADTADADGGGASGTARTATMMSGSASGSFSAPATLTVWTAEDAMFQLRAAKEADGGTAVLSEWYEQMQEMVSSLNDGGSHKEKAEVVWQQGFLELSVGLDEWVPRFFLLSSKDGLLVFVDQAAKRRHDAEAKFSLYQIARATRGTGMEFFENGLKVHLTTGELLEVRAPHEAEMHRWLSTLNMHCIAPRVVGPSAAAVAASGGGGGHAPPHGGTRDALPEVGQRRTLIAGWVLAKVGAGFLTGYKKRFCRLAHEVEEASDALISRKLLYMTSREDEVLEPKAAHPLWEVVNIVEERKTSGKTKLMLKRADDDEHTINIIAEEDA